MEEYRSQEFFEVGAANQGPLGKGQAYKVVVERVSGAAEPSSETGGFKMFKDLPNLYLEPKFESFAKNFNISAIFWEFSEDLAMFSKCFEIL